MIRALYRNISWAIFDVSNGRDAQSVLDFVNSEMSEFNFMEKLVDQNDVVAALMEVCAMCMFPLQAL
jgi:hypothetical protein